MVNFDDYFLIDSAFLGQDAIESAAMASATAVVSTVSDESGRTRPRRRVTLFNVASRIARIRHR